MYKNKKNIFLLSSQTKYYALNLLLWSQRVKIFILRQIYYPCLNFLEPPKKRAPEGPRIKGCALIAGNESIFAIFHLNIRRVH